MIYVTPPAATGVLTSDNTNVSNNDTVTIGRKTYTFKTVLTGGANEILIGANADASLTNLQNIINSGRSAASAYTTLTSDNTNVSDGETVTIGNKTYTFKSSLSEALATQTLTSDNTNVSDGETVTIGSITYVFKNVFSAGVPYEVKIGEDADASLTNLSSAINKEEIYSGTRYSSKTTAHPSVTSGLVSSHAIVVTSKVVGIASNDIATTETSSHLSWGGSTLTGGSNATANQVKIGANADASLQNLKDAINGTVLKIGVTISTGTIQSTEAIAGTLDTGAHTLIITALSEGTSGNSLASTETSSHLSFTSSTFAGGTVATPSNLDVSCSDVSNHSITVTAKTRGVSGDTIATTETSSHLSWGKTTLVDGSDDLTRGTTASMTGTTSTLLLKAPGEGLRNYITTIVVSNSHASTGTDVVIQDGQDGEVLMTIPAASAYGGGIVNLTKKPLKQPSINTALYCANLTTGAATKVTAVGYRGV